MCIARHCSKVQANIGAKLRDKSLVVLILDPWASKTRSVHVSSVLTCLLMFLQQEDAENIGYVIPTPVIEHFINDYERNGQYTAFPSLGIEWQKMESPFMRKALGMQVRLLCSLVVCVVLAFTCPSSMHGWVRTCT